MTVFVPLAISICCYTWIGISNLRQADYPHAGVWFSYALAQSMFVWYEWEKIK